MTAAGLSQRRGQTRGGGNSQGRHGLPNVNVCSLYKASEPCSGWPAAPAEGQSGRLSQNLRLLRRELLICQDTGLVQLSQLLQLVCRITT
jgi:hypothetical protein